MGVSVLLCSRSNKKVPDGFSLMGTIDVIGGKTYLARPSFSYHLVDVNYKQRTHVINERT